MDKKYLVFNPSHYLNGEPIIASAIPSLLADSQLGRLQIQNAVQRMEAWEVYETRYFKIVCFDADTLEGALLANGYPLGKMDHHGTDLYVEMALAEKVVKNWYKANNLPMDALVTQFNDAITGQPSYDCAFQWHDLKEVDFSKMPGRFELLSIKLDSPVQVLVEFFNTIEDAQKQMKEEMALAADSDLDPDDPSIVNLTEYDSPDGVFGFHAWGGYVSFSSTNYVWEIVDLLAELQTLAEL